MSESESYMDESSYDGSSQDMDYAPRAPAQPSSNKSYNLYRPIRLSTKQSPKLSKISKKLSSVFVLLPAVTIYIITRIITLYFNLESVKNILDEFFYAIVASIIVNRAARQEFTFIASAILENKFVVYCGKISYGMYLYHLFMPFVYFYVQSKTGLHIDNLFLYFLALYFTTFVLSHFSWLIIEEPINNLKYKFPYFK